MGTSAQPLDSLKSHALFPGRKTLYVHEVARVLSMSKNQVIALIEECQDTGGKSGLLGINIGNGGKSAENAKGNSSSRKYWRIPVAAYDAFVQRGEKQEINSVNHRPKDPERGPEARNSDKSFCSGTTAFCSGTAAAAQKSKKPRAGRPV